MATAASAHELVRTFDCQTASCTGIATRPGGLCTFCANVEKRPELQTLRWRRLVRRVDPPEQAHCSPLVFQAVASALADHAGHGKFANPSIARLAADCRISDRSVQSALAGLHRHGLVRRDTRGGRGKTTCYELVLTDTLTRPTARVF